MTFLYRLLPKSKIGKVIGIAGLSVVFLLAFIVWVLPSIVLPKITAAISDATHRTARIDALKLNPFELSVRVEKFELLEPSGEKFVGFDTLFVNVNAFEMIRGVIGFDEIALVGPSVHVAINKEGRYNFGDLIPPSDANKKPAPADSTPLVSIAKFRLENGDIAFADNSRATPFKAELKTLNLGLDNFTTQPDSAGRYNVQAATADGETLKWNGDLGFSPLRSKGHFELTNMRARTLWSYVQDQLGFVIDRGLLAASSDYTLDFSPGKSIARLDHAAVSLSDLLISDPNTKHAAFALNNLSVRETVVDVTNHSVDVGVIESTQGIVNLARESDGKIDLVKLFESKKPIATPAASPVSKGATASAPESPWAIRIQKVSVREWGVEFHDKMVAPHTKTSLSPINIEVANIDLATHTAMKLRFDIGVNKTGKLSGQGDVTPSPFTNVMALEVESLDLVPFQTYWSSATRLQLADGNLNAKLQMDGQLKQGGYDVIVTGGASLRRIRGVDPVVNEDLVRWEELAVKDVRFTTTPLALDIKEVLASAPYLRMVIGTDGNTNLQHIQVATPNATTKPAVATDKTAAPPPAAPMLMKIAAVNIQNGSINFADQTLSPHFDVGIQSLKGSVLGLSSKDIARATVALDGKVDKYAPVTIRGKINPLSDNAFSDVVVAFRGLEMTTFTPYSAKFAGHKIDKGKLNIDLHYLLSQKLLKGENKVIIDQLELGEKVDSPDAIGLPVRLAIALLKDSNGVIDLDMPITGSLDEPDFHYGKLVWQAIKNLIVKAATAPFKFLASAFSGGEAPPDHVRFALNDARLAPEEQQKLLALADALSKKPSLNLELRGSAGEADRQAMAAALNAPAVTDKPVVTTATAPPAPPPPVRVVTDEELRALAQARAEASLDFLIQAGKLDPQRVFMLEVDIHAGTEEFIDLPLTVQVR